jgi:RNA polymerase sigma-70 factor, ECF subfamily
MKMSAAALMVGTSLDRAKAGYKEGFEAIVRQHGGLVYSIGFHFFGSSALAEEISQDIFLELHRNLHKIESEAHLVSWLRRSTSNRCIDTSRRSSYRSEVPLNDSFHPATAGATSDPLLHETLRKQVAALPEWQRAVVILRYQEDLDTEEISQMLNIPVNTVKSRLHRAMETLRGRMERKKVVKV